MKSKHLLLFILFTLIQLPAWSQIDDDIDVEGDTIRMPQVTNVNGSNAILNKYRLGDGIRFSSLDKSYSMNVSGFLQPSMFVQKFPDDSDLYARIRMRRVRLRLQGNAVGDKIRYRLDVDLVRGSEIDSDVGSLLQDAWVQYRPFGNKLAISIGQRATPTDNRELMISSYALQLNERSRLSSLFGTIREVGIFADGTYKLSGESYLRPSLAITDGDGPISKANTRYGGMKYGGRLNYLPFGLFRISGETRANDMVYELSPKLSLGAAYSYNVGVSDRRGGRESGVILYRNDSNEVALPDYGKLVADFLFKYRGWSLMGEFAKSWVYVPSTITQRVRNDGSTSRDFLVNGEQNVAAYIKDRMIVGSAFNIQGGYLFRNFWSINARYTHMIPDTYSYMNNSLYYARNNVYEFGFTRYLTKSYAAKIQATFGLVESNGEVRKANGVTYSGLEANFNIMFQLAF